MAQSVLVPHAGTLMGPVPPAGEDVGTPHQPLPQAEVDPAVLIHTPHKEVHVSRHVQDMAGRYDATISHHIQVAEEERARSAALSKVIQDSNAAMQVAADRQAGLQAEVEWERRQRKRAESDLADSLGSAAAERETMLRQRMAREEETEATLLSLQARLQALEYPSDAVPLDGLLSPPVALSALSTPRALAPPSTAEASLPSLRNSMIEAVERHRVEVESLGKQAAGFRMSLCMGQDAAGIAGDRQLEQAVAKQRVLQEDLAEKDKLIVMLQHELQNVSAVLEETTSANRELAQQVLQSSNASHSAQQAVLEQSQRLHEREAQLQAAERLEDETRNKLLLLAEEVGDKDSLLTSLTAQVDAMVSASAEAAAAHEAERSTVQAEHAQRSEAARLLQGEVARLTEACTTLTECNLSLRSELELRQPGQEGLQQAELRLAQLERGRSQDMAAAQAEHAALTAQAEQLRVERAQMSERCADALLQVDQSSVEMQELREAKQGVEAALAEALHGPKTDDARLREALVLTEKQNDDLRMTVLELRDALEATTQPDGLSGDVVRLSRELTERDVAVAAHVEALQRMQEETAAQRHEQRRAAEQLKAQLILKDDAMQELAHCREAARASAADHEMQKATVAAMEREMETLRARLEAEAVRERRHRERAEAELLQLQGQVRSNAESEGRLEGEALRLATQVRKLELMCQEERGNAAESTKMNVLSGRRIAELEANVARLEAKASDYEVALAGQRSTISELHERASALSARDTDRDSAVVQQEMQISRLIADKEVAYKEVDAIRQAFTDLEASRPTMASPLPTLASELAVVARSSSWVMRQLADFSSSVASSQQLTQEELQAHTAYLIDLVAMAVK